WPTTSYSHVNPPKSSLWHNDIFFSRGFMRIFQTQLTADQVDTSQRHNAPVVTLSFEDRRRARQRVQLNTGEEVGIVLQTGHSLNDGDWLQDNSGQLIMVRAAQETILRVTS